MKPDVTRVNLNFLNEILSSPSSKSLPFSTYYWEKSVGDNKNIKPKNSCKNVEIRMVISKRMRASN